MAGDKVIRDLLDSRHRPCNLPICGRGSVRPDVADRLAHVDEAGRPRMVDVSAKPVTERSAEAQGLIRMSPGTLAAALSGAGPKGPVPLPRSPV